LDLEHVILETDGHKVKMTINKPETLNALNTSLYNQIEQACNDIRRRLDEGEDIRCVIVTGAGEKSFVAGADISEMSTMNLAEAQRFGVECNRAFRNLETLPVPTVAALNGYTLGGGLELALACDLRIASKKARLAFPETGLGITPGSGGTQRLSRLAGPAVAMEMIFTGRMINGEEALNMGIVSDTAEPEELMNVVNAFCDKICQKAPIAIRAAKRAIRRGLECDTDTGLAFEIEAFSQCFTTEDQKEGMRGFLEKRKDIVYKNK
jgi:enoyl-CoA hydratase